ncbi:MAG: PAS domain S-box protein [Lunatimonas sp.]|uniref:PAS domain S-box protein n=1 Tax=Lunatimonas sp. TaxID=2060141 RepID=UPI00263B78AF|nr:PAS domain S-box protein [Lunatimonas sp.]MCC5938796.1 PAS domain S-box protein [Lunatimonas sp.]
MTSNSKPESAIDHTSTNNDALRIIAVGASAGGLEALQDFLSNLRVLDNCCVVIAQHMSPTHRSMLVQLLAKATPFAIQEAVNLQTLTEKTIYITPPDTEISIVEETIHLTKPHSSIGPKPSVDVLFESLAKEDNQVIAIILSGTGTDGSEGINRLAMAGDAYILAQEPSSAKYDGMPNSAIQTGHVHEVLSAKELGKHLTGLMSLTATSDLFRTQAFEKTPYEKIVELLSKKSGTDFFNYKNASLTRRLEKRVSTLHMDSLDRYVEYLEENPEEVNELFKMVLIGVTSFFRDTESFAALESCLDRLIQSKKNHESIRVWIPGCSTGEEAYSIAIMLHRLLKTHSKEQLDVQIFATDIDDRAIAHARSAVYPASALEKLSRETIAQYFTPKGQDFELAKSLRVMVLFSRHDIMRNPPFLKLDLISCRNLLIYFKNSLQQQLIPLFHFALLPSGYLFLGKSESIGAFTSLFGEENAKHRIYKKKISQGLQTIRFSALKPQTVPAKKTGTLQSDTASNLKEAVKKTLLLALDIPYVVVNESHDIQEVHGDVRLYISLSEGGIQANLIKMLNPELQIEVRSVLSKCIKSNKGIKSKIKKFILFGSIYYVRVSVFPIEDRAGAEPLFMVLFEQLDIEEFIVPGQPTNNGDAEPFRVRELEEELNETKEQLQTYIEEIETSNEELQSLIEELQSTNEELQSANEELETTNEELQSTNEEIQVAYMELKSAHETLEAKELDLQYLQANTEALLNNELQAFVLVDNNYLIKKFNTQAVHLFQNLSGRDLVIGSLILDYLPEGETEQFIQNFKDVIAGRAFTGEKQFKDKSGQSKWLAVNYTPVLFNLEEVTGISLGLLDITSLKEIESNLTKAEKLISSVYNVVSLGICITDEEGYFVDVNEAYCKLYNYTREELIGEKFTKVVPPAHRDRLQSLHDRAIKTGLEEIAEERVVTKHGTTIEVEVSSDLMIQPDGKKFKITSVKDITQQKGTKKLLAEAQEMAQIGAWEYIVGTDRLNYSRITRLIYEIPESYMLSVTNGVEFYKEGENRDLISKAITDCIEKGTPFDLELEFVSYVGTPKWVRSIGKAETVDGEIVRVFGSIQDITARKQAEERIRESNQRFTYVTQATSDVIWDWDIATGKVHWGENYEKVFGKIANDTRLSDLEQVHRRLDTAELESILDDANAALKSENTRWQCEHRYLKADGTFAMVSNKALIVRTKEGRPVRVIGAMQDITQQYNKEIEKKLQREISLIFNQNTGLIAALGQSTRFLGDFAKVDLAEAWLIHSDKKTIKLVSQHLRTHPAEIFQSLSTQYDSFLKGEGLPGTVWATEQPEIWDQVGSKSEFFRNHAARKSGISAIFGVPLIHRDETIGVMVFGTTGSVDRLQSLKAIFSTLEEYLGGELMRKKLETELNQIIETAPDLIGIADYDGYFIRINASACHMLEYTEEEITSRPFFDFVHPDDLAKTHTEFKRLTTDTSPIVFENRYITKSGKTIWLTWSSTALPGEGVIYTVGKNITKQKSLQMMLDNAFKMARIGGWEVNLNGEITQWSEVAREIHEVEDASYVPDVEAALKFYREDYREFVAKTIENCMQSGTSFDFEAPIITAKGNEKWIRSIGQAEFVNGKISKLFGSVQDIHDKKMAEQQLLIFKRIIETSQEGIAVAGLEGQVIYLNPSFQDRLGFDTDELQTAGGPPSVYKNKEIAKEVFDRLLVGESWKGDIDLMDRHGKVTPYFLSAGPIRDEKGNLVAVFGIHTDIGERKQAEDRLRQNLQTLEDYKFALDQAAIVALTDSKGNILSVNDKFCEISKYSREELVGSTHQIINSGYHSREFFHEMWKTLAKGQVWHGSIKNKSKDGTDYWMDSTMVPFLDDNGLPKQYLAIRFEITDRVMATEKLEKANHELEKLNLALEARAQELAISNSELEQFAYVASHDLQEPLRMITSFLAQLNKKYSSLFDDKAKEYIHFALDGASRMRQIILDLLEFSRVGKNDEKLSEVSLTDIVTEVTMLNRKLIEETQAKISVKGLPTIIGFRSPIVQVFNNLIGNALKYRKKSEAPEIEIACENQETQYKISVRDNGIGIEEEYFQKIFIIFQRLHNKNEYSGTGIGLAIVKKIVENMGGNVWLESTKNQGSTFFFTLPKQPFSSSPTKSGSL